MARTIHRDAQRARQGFVTHREPRRAQRRQATRSAIIRSEMNADMPAVRAALSGRYSR